MRQELNNFLNISVIAFIYFTTKIAIYVYNVYKCGRIFFSHPNVNQMGPHKTAWMKDLSGDFNNFPQTY